VVLVYEFTRHVINSGYGGI